MVTSTNHVIPGAGYTLREAPGTLGIIATSSCQILVKTKKVLPSKRGAPGGTVPHGNSGPGQWQI